jgi:serine/threonine protein kinase
MLGRYHFLDMELCDLTLGTYLHRDWDPNVAAKVPYFAMDLPATMRMTQILGIMEDTIKGVVFIHTNNEIHRDIKPRNSN